MRLKIQTGEAVAAIAECDPLPLEDRAIDPDGETLDILYRQHRAPLLRFVRRYAPVERAQDVVQHVFVRLAGLGPGEAQAIRSPLGYMRRAARNLLRDHARDDHRHPVDLYLGTEDALAAPHDPVAQLEARDLLERLEQALLRLPVRTREIFLAHRIDGYSYAEIARRTGLCMTTVETHMKRAIASLDRINRR